MVALVTLSSCSGGGSTAASEDSGTSTSGPVSSAPVSVTTGRPTTTVRPTGQPRSTVTAPTTAAGPAAEPDPANSGYCLLAAAVRGGGPKQPREDSTPAEVQRIFEQANQQARELADLGPGPIKGDLETVAAAVAGFTAAAAAVGYQLASVPAEARAAAATPAVEQASADIRAYEETVCHIPPS